MSEPLPQHPRCRSAIPGIRILAFAVFRQAFVEAMVEQREREAGITPGDPNVPVSWDGLEAVLGKAQVDRMKNGLSEGG